MENGAALRKLKAGEVVAPGEKGLVEGAAPSAPLVCAAATERRLPKPLNEAESAEGRWRA